MLWFLTGLNLSHFLSAWLIISHPQQDNFIGSESKVWIMIMLYLQLLLLLISLLNNRFLKWIVFVMNVIIFIAFQVIERLFL